LAKVVFEESWKRLIWLGIVTEDHVPTIKAPNVSSETDDFVIILLNIRITLYVDKHPYIWINSNLVLIKVGVSYLRQK
jgi:hypothetical protein